MHYHLLKFERQDLQYLSITNTLFQSHTQVQNLIGKKKENVNKRERKVTGMVFLMVFAFIIAWIGYALVCILRLFDIKLTSLAVAWSMLLAKTGSWLNAVVFVFMNNQVSS